MFNVDLCKTLLDLSGNTDSLYSVYQRRKKNGKLRIITAPPEELKALQAEFAQFLNTEYKDFFDKRPHITGFVPNRNIINNAEVHLNKEWLVNIDLKDFFPSITAELIEKLVLKDIKFKNYNTKEMLHLVCYKGVLPQGSPCSPVIANIVAAKLIDEDLLDAAMYYDLAFTRYADDLTFSTNKLLMRDQVIHFTDIICKIVNNSQHLKVNDQKINIKHRSQKQMVTGVLVNNKEVGVNKVLRNRLRAILHQHAILDKPLDDKVCGILGFIKQVNTEQFTKLTKDFPCKLLTLNSSNQTTQMKDLLKHLDSLN